MAEMNADSGRVNPVFDSKGLAVLGRFSEFFEELRLGNDLLNTTVEDFELFVDVPHQQPGPSQVIAGACLERYRNKKPHVDRLARD